jgi:hypothetical protein
MAEHRTAPIADATVVVTVAVVVAVVLAGAAGLAACQHSSSTSEDRSADSSDPAASVAEPPPVPTSAVILTPPGKDPVRVAVEVVRTPRKIRRGLMYRRSLPADQGMLFLMGEERVQSFWMRNTLIPLDMIFINSDMKVVGVAADAVPLTDDSRRVDGPSLYVLEVNAGFSAAHGIGPGVPVEFADVDGAP